MMVGIGKDLKLDWKQMFLDMMYLYFVGMSMAEEDFFTLAKSETAGESLEQNCHLAAVKADMSCKQRVRLWNTLGFTEEDWDKTAKRVSELKSYKWDALMVKQSGNMLASLEKHCKEQTEW